MDDAALLSGSHGVVRPVRVRLPADQRLLRLGHGIKALRRRHRDDHGDGPVPRADS